MNISNPIRRRSLYVWVEHPTPEREAEIIASRTPGAGVEFHQEIAGIARSFRNYSLEKPPSVSEMIDFANALRLMGSDHVTEEQRDVLLPFLAKTEKDRHHLLLREGFQSLLVDGARYAQDREQSGWHILLRAQDRRSVDPASGAGRHSIRCRVSTQVRNLLPAGRGL